MKEISPKIQYCSRSTIPLVYFEINKEKEMIFVSFKRLTNGHSFYHCLFFSYLENYFLQVFHTVAYFKSDNSFHWRGQATSSSDVYITQSDCHLLQMHPLSEQLSFHHVPLIKSCLGWGGPSSYVVWGWQRFAIFYRPILVHLDRI